jgi:transcriptional regulator with XRE-family HTH domain
VSESEDTGISGRIKARMRTAAMTQQQLAAATGMSESQLSRVLTRKRRLTAGELGAIADALTVPATLLLDQPLGDYGLALAARLRETRRDELLDVAFSRAIELLELRAVLCGLGVLMPESRRARSRAAQPRAAARALRARPDGHASLVDLAQSQLGIDIGVERFPKGLHGLAVTDDQAALVLLNRFDSSWHRERTLARLLWHVLHGRYRVFYVDADGSTVNANADEFAVALVPDAATFADEESPLCDPPSALRNAALTAFAQGRVGMGLVAQVYGMDDLDTLRAELADAGWQQPIFAAPSAY